MWQILKSVILESLWSGVTDAAISIGQEILKMAKKMEGPK